MESSVEGEEGRRVKRDKVGKEFMMRGRVLKRGGSGGSGRELSRGRVRGTELSRGRVRGRGR